MARSKDSVIGECMRISASSGAPSRSEDDQSYLLFAHGLFRNVYGAAAGK